MTEFSVHGYLGHFRSILPGHPIEPATDKWISYTSSAPLRKETEMADHTRRITKSYPSKDPSLLGHCCLSSTAYSLSIVALFSDNRWFGGRRVLNFVTAEVATEQCF